jgi:sporulation protein YlmC with PRC-barrel domain
VVTPDGKELGSVEYLVIGKDGQIKYVVLNRGGFIGIGDEEYAIPWRCIQVGQNLDTLVADVDEETIQKFTDQQKQSSSKSEEGKYAKTSKSSAALTPAMASGPYPSVLEPSRCKYPVHPIDADTLR